MKTIFSRNVFIDSELNNTNGQSHKLNFPTNDFSIKSHQFMKLVLTSFEFRNNIYSINPTNNVFYIYVPEDGVTPENYIECVIEPGTYENFSDLAIAIQATLNDCIPEGNAMVEFVQIKRKFKITFDGDYPYYICCFKVSDDASSNQISDNGLHNDVHEIIGGIVNTKTPVPGEPPKRALKSIAGTFAVESAFVGSKSSIETLFLRTDLQTNNFQSVSFERGIRNGSLTQSNIWARIPINATSTDSIVQFQDTDSLYSIILQQSHLSSFSVCLTDHSGRSLPEVCPKQSVNGNIAFKLSFRWEIIEQETPEGSHVVQPPQLKNMRIKM